MLEVINEGSGKTGVASQQGSQLHELINSYPGIAYRAVNDGRWGVVFASKECLTLTGRDPDSRGDGDLWRLDEILVSDDRVLPIEQILSGGNSYVFHCEYTLLTAGDGSRRVIECGRGVFDKEGGLWAIDGFVTDVGRHHRLSNRLVSFAGQDSVTNLPNRQQFEAHVREALEDAKSHGLPIAILHIDLDQFKLINDTLGHAIGDEMLRQVAVRLRRTLRTCDVLARLGGDEFGVVLNDCSAEKAVRVAGKLRTAVENNRFHWKDRHFNFTASIGIATASRGNGAPEHLMSAADNAVYAAKENGRNRAHLYHPKDDFLQKRNREMQWAIEIPEAMREGRLYLEQQQIVSVGGESADAIGSEVLLRMLDRNGDIVAPGIFLPAAERYNLAVSLDTWVLETLFMELNHQPTWLEQRGTCFINLSGQSFSDPGFLEKVCALLCRSAFPADRLCFEITETAAVANMDQALQMVERLQRLGCRFALDDFGSGLSSFGYLRDFSVEYLKIDGSFVRKVVDDPVSRAIVASINDVGHTTGKKIIAEFVESDDILDVLRSIGVDYAQGFGISVPTRFSSEESNES